VVPGSCLSLPELADLRLPPLAAPERGETQIIGREVAPRLAIAVVASNSSLLLVSKAIGLSNGISSVLSGGALPADAVSQLTKMLQDDAAQGGIAVLLLILATLVMAVVVAITYIIRVMALVLLIAMAPLALSGYALPYTSWAPRWWWRAGQSGSCQNR
jgi:hypothetical protein